MLEMGVAKRGDMTLKVCKRRGEGGGVVLALVKGRDD